MASLLLAGAGLITTAVVTGFGFAGGALAFQRGEQFIEQKIADSKRPDTQKGKEIQQGEPKRARDQNPFNETRFLSDVEKKEISQLLKKDPPIDL